MRDEKDDKRIPNAESGMENEAKNLHRRSPANNGSLIA